jgi:predicted nucleic acid-binding protein
VKIVVDSYAWIEIFRGSEKGRAASDTIEESDQVVTPDIVLAEVARKYIREGIKENLVRKRIRTIVESSQVFGIDEECAAVSAKAYLEIENQAKKLKLHKPSLFDGIILGTARITESRVLTGDPHFRELPETIWLG